MTRSLFANSAFCLTVDSIRLAFTRSVGNQRTRQHCATRRIMLSSLLLTLAGCGSTEVIKANSTPAIQAQVELPEHLYMDIGILPLDPNIPATEKEQTKKFVVPDVRRAESQFIAYHMKDTLEQTGNWGAVRVTPNVSEAVDLVVSGMILISNGETLKLRLKASDSTGKVWVSKEYKDLASKYSYKGINEDPFQDLYNDFANDLLRFREFLSEEKIERIRQTSSLIFAKSLAPGAFGQYLKVSRSGQTSITQLPADQDRMLSRVTKIKEREYLFVDTLDEYYGQFYRDMKESYDEWRFATYEEALNLKEMQRQSTARLITGGLLIAGGIYAGSESGTYAGDVAAAGAVIGGIAAVKSGLDKRREAEIHAESLRELSQSLGSEITPYVLDVEGRTIELTGTADAQYEQWRGILQEIYVAETGNASENKVE